jgi:hypothetical protein
MLVPKSMASQCTFSLPQDMGRLRASETLMETSCLLEPRQGAASFLNDRVLLRLIVEGDRHLCFGEQQASFALPDVSERIRPARDRRRRGVDIGDAVDVVATSAVGRFNQLGMRGIEGPSRVGAVDGN